MRRSALARSQTLAGGTVAATLAITLTSAPAHAQALAAVDVRTWRPSTDADASLVLEPTATPGPWNWNVGVWAQYAQDPIARATPGGTRRPVEHATDLDVVEGLGLGERVAVGLEVPIVVGQDGDGSSPVTTSGLGDIAVLAKATIVPDDHAGVHGGFGLAALGELSLPTGDRGAFAADGTFGGAVRALAEYAFGIAAVRAELGYAVRGSQPTWPSAAPGGTTFGDTIPWSFGLVVRPKVFAPGLDGDDRQLWELAAHGSLPGGPVAPFGLGRSGAAALSPALLAVDDRIALGHAREVYVLAGGDVGLDAAIGVPTIRAVVAVSWAPRSHDRDGDGIPDDRDDCPDLPEDRDGIQDADGCPEDDADGDAILDRDDACPLVPGVPSSDPKQNGCPGPATPSPSPSPSPSLQAPAGDSPPIDEKKP